MDKGCGRSREGAWIEIITDGTLTGPGYGRSREGAWIEIFRKVINYV